MHDYLIGLIILQLLMATLYYWILLQLCHSCKWLFIVFRFLFAS